MLNLNPFFVLEDDPTPARNSQVARASSLVFSSLKFVSDLRRGVMAPDMGRRNTLSACLSFAACSAHRALRRQGRDIIKTDDTATHVVVLCRGQFYYFDALWPTGLSGCVREGPEKQLHGHTRRCPTEGHRAVCHGCGRGADGGKRDKWASCREKLCKVSQKNSEVLKIIDGALFIVCLDDCTPSNIDDRAANMLHGSYQLERHTRAHEGVLQTGTLMNRWYDKLQLIVCANGAAGINFEHSAVDGHTVLPFRE